MSMFTYNLTLATEEPLERVRDRVSAFFPEVEWTNGEANLGGWIVVVSSPSTYQPSVLYANEMLGRSATAEVSFLVSKGLDVEADRRIWDRVLQVSAELIHSCDAVASMEYLESMVMTRAPGAPIVLYEWFPGALTAERLDRLAHVGIDFTVTGPRRAT
ncbi:MAG: hypothetical protein IPJ15_14400 [Actinomycetales bacterium]|jgi:hypothetical protein|nr:hypothetical protein [Candidatus Phosphoribacter baldrii]MBK7612373.1 hypothetical protein [Candidatus Phosphoribacter baldrii]